MVGSVQSEMASTDDDASAHKSLRFRRQPRRTHDPCKHSMDELLFIQLGSMGLKPETIDPKKFKQVEKAIKTDIARKAFKEENPKATDDDFKK